MRPIGSSTTGSTDLNSDVSRVARQYPALGAEGLAGEVRAARTGGVTERRRRGTPRPRTRSPRRHERWGRRRTCRARRSPPACGARSPPRRSAPRARGRPRGTRAARRGDGPAAAGRSRSRTLATEPAASDPSRASAPMRRGPADLVGRETGVALERAERALGLRPEDAVLAAGVEAERVEPALQLDHVVAAQHRLAQVEQPVAEREAALDQRGPRLGAADAVDPQAARCAGTRARAPTVDASYTPSTVTAIPAAPSRCWTSRTASPRSPRATFGQLFTGR